jgi:hypothetical protein
MIKAALIIISLFLLISCGQNQAPTAPATTPVTLSTDTAKTTLQNKKPTDTTLAFINNARISPTFFETIKFAPPIFRVAKNDEDDDDEDDDDDDELKSGKYHFLYKIPANQYDRKQPAEE